MQFWMLINAIGLASAAEPEWNSLDLTESVKEFDREPEGVLTEKPVESRASNVNLRIRPILPRFELKQAPYALMKRPRPLRESISDVC